MREEKDLKETGESVIVHGEEGGSWGGGVTHLQIMMAFHKQHAVQKFHYCT